MTDVSDRSAPPGTGTRSRARVITLCWTAIVVDGYDLIVYGTVLPTLISGEWALDAGTAGWIGSLALVGMLVGALLAGTVTDRLGRRRLMIICIAWFSVAMALCALAPSPEGVRPAAVRRGRRAGRGGADSDRADRRVRPGRAAQRGERPDVLRLLRRRRRRGAVRDRAAGAAGLAGAVLDRRRGRRGAARRRRGGVAGVGGLPGRARSPRGGGRTGRPLRDAGPRRRPTRCRPRRAACAARPPPPARHAAVLGRHRVRAAAGLRPQHLARPDHAPGRLPAGRALAFLLALNLGAIVGRRCSGRSPTGSGHARW